METYKHLGMSQVLKISKADMRQTLRQRSYGHLKKILKVFYQAERQQWLSHACLKIIPLAYPSGLKLGRTG